MSLCSWVPLPCAPLLVGDTRVDMQWPGKLRDVPPELRQLVSRLQVTLQVMLGVCELMRLRMCGCLTYKHTHNRNV